MDSSMTIFLLFLSSSTNCPKTLYLNSPTLTFQQVLKAFNIWKYGMFLRKGCHKGAKLVVFIPAFTRRNMSITLMSNNSNEIKLSVAWRYLKQDLFWIYIGYVKLHHIHIHTMRFVKNPILNKCETDLFSLLATQYRIRGVAARSVFSFLCVDMVLKAGEWSESRLLSEVEDNW